MTREHPIVSRRTCLGHVSGAGTTWARAASRWQALASAGERWRASTGMILTTHAGNGQCRAGVPGCSPCRRALCQWRAGVGHRWFSAAWSVRGFTGVHRGSPGFSVYASVHCVIRPCLAAPSAGTDPAAPIRRRSSPRLPRGPVTVRPTYSRFPACCTPGGWTVPAGSCTRGCHWYSGETRETRETRGDKTSGKRQAVMRK